MLLFVPSLALPRVLAKDPFPCFIFIRVFPRVDHMSKMSIIWLQFSSSAAIFWCLRRSRPRIAAACVSSWTVSFSYWKSSIVFFYTLTSRCSMNFLVKFPMVFFRSCFYFFVSFFCWRSGEFFRWIFAEKNNRSSHRNTALISLSLCEKNIFLLNGRMILDSVRLRSLESEQGISITEKL